MVATHQPQMKGQESVRSLGHGTSPWPEICDSVGPISRQLSNFRWPLWKGVGALNSSLLPLSFHSQVWSNHAWEHSFSRWFCKVPRNATTGVQKRTMEGSCWGEHQTLWAIEKAGICSLLCHFLVLWHWASVLNFLGLFSLILQVRDSCFMTFFILSSFDIWRF